MKAPILITGIPRSGATMIAAAIHTCGAFSGTMTKKSMFCNDLIRQRIVVPYIEFSKVDKNFIPDNWDSLVEKVIKEDGYKGGEWMYKDNRSTLIWRVWHNAYPDAKWVIVRRRTGDVVNSCMKTTYMTEHSTKEGWLDMVHEYEGHFVDMINEGIQHKVIWPERMLDKDYRQLIELCDWLGLQWNPKALDYIDTLLWGTKQKVGG